MVNHHLTVYNLGRAKTLMGLAGIPYAVGCSEEAISWFLTGMVRERVR